MSRMDKLPDLNPQQSTLIRDVHAYWRKQRRFPKTVALGVHRRNELRATASTLPWEILYRDKEHTDDDTLKLTLIGLAFCPGEERILEAFLELLRRAARTIIGNPSEKNGKNEITDKHLRDLLTDLSQEDFDLISPIVRDGLGWGGSYDPNGTMWRSGIPFHAFRFEKVESINDYLRLNGFRPKGKIRPEQAHVGLIHDVYDHRFRTGNWPDACQFIIDYRAKADAVVLLGEIPSDFVREEPWHSPDSKRIVLTLNGMVLSGIAKKDLELFGRLVAGMAKRFEGSPEDPMVTTGDLAREVGVPESEVEQLSETIQGEWRLGVNVYQGSKPWRFKLSERIMEFAGIQSFAEYLERREALDKKDKAASERAVTGPFDWEQSATGGNLMSFIEPGQEIAALPFAPTPVAPVRWDTGAAGSTAAYSCLRCGKLSETPFAIGPNDRALCPPCTTAAQSISAIMKQGMLGSLGVGAKFKQYALQEPLGDGGFGDVWKAQDQKLGRLVALKFPKYPRGEDLDRLRVEARAAAQLDHPNIARIYAIEEDHQREFIIMQYIEGTTLDRHVPAGPQDYVQILRDVAKAVAYAHSRNIVHRDLKPQNIMVDVQGKPFVTDFGLALMAEMSRRLTTTGQYVGTPSYMAPEQETSRDVDGRADIYALGVVLHEVVTGELPTRPSPGSPSILKPMPAGLAPLQPILRKCLEYDPANRYAKAEELATSLGSALAPAITPSA